MNYEPLPEGVYTGCSIPIRGSDSQVFFGESSAKGTPFIRVNLGITEGDKAGESIYHELYLTEKTIEKTIKSLRALGFTGEQFAAFVTQRPSTSVQFEIVHEEYNSRVRAKVKWIGAAPKVLARGDLDALSDKFSKELTATTAPDESSSPSDEIPF